MECRVVEYELPMSVRGFVKKKQGEYCIVINNLLSYEMKMKTLEHELNHIINGDLEKDCPVDMIEAGIA